MTPERLSTWLLPSGWETGAAPRTADEAAAIDAIHNLPMFKNRDSGFCQCKCGCAGIVGWLGPLCSRCERKREGHGRDWR